jgi:hypothetical protein
VDIRPASVPQTSVIFFALLVGFLVFITIKGELGAYLWVIGLGGSAPPGAAPAGPATTMSTGQIPGTGGMPPYTQNPDGSICVDGRCSVMTVPTPRKRAL